MGMCATWDGEEYQGEVCGWVSGWVRRGMEDTVDLALGELLIIFLFRACKVYIKQVKFC